MKLYIKRIEQYPPTATVCDVGCGSGTVLHMLPAFKQALCIDNSESMLQVASAYRPTRNIIALKRNMQDLWGIPSHFCDVTVMNSALHYLTDLQAVARSVTEMRRVARSVIYIFDIRYVANERKYVQDRQRHGLAHSDPHLSIPPSWWTSRGWKVVTSNELHITKDVYYNAPYSYSAFWRR